MLFNAELKTTNSTVEIKLSGDLDRSTAPILKEKIELVAKQNPEKLILNTAELEYLSSAGLRVLIFARQKMGAKVAIYLVSPQEMVLDTITKTGFHHSIYIVEEAQELEAIK